jgi:nucleoside triphosphatase
MENNNLFPRGIEVVTGAIMRNKKGEILFARSSKWSNKWTLPGGHVEPGETVIEAAWREAREETGLKLKPGSIIHFGEMINPKDFHRPAHFIYFDVTFEVLDEAITLDQTELTESIWILPEKAFDIDLAESYPEVIKVYLNHLKKLA